MKKILSVILAAVMLFALLPTAFASGEETEAIEFVFNYNAKGLSKQTDGTSIVNLTAMLTGYETWCIEGFSWVYKPSLREAHLQWYALEKNLIDDFAVTSTQKGEYGTVSENYIEYDTSFSAAFVLEIKAAGTYKTEIGYTGNVCGTVNEVYLIKKNNADDVYVSNYDEENKKLTEMITTSCNEESHLGTIDEYATEKDIKDETLKTVNITEPGEYYLILESIGRSKGSQVYGTANGDAVYTYINSFTLTPAGTQEDIISSFELDDSVEAKHSPVMQAPLAAALDGCNITASVSAADADGDGIYTVTAGDTDETGEYTFLYWIKGLTSDKANKIVSRTATIEEYKPQNGANYLIAVYEKKGAETEAKAEFYDGNGQLLYTTEADDIDENNVAVADGVITLPALPQMANYTSATRWQLYGDVTNTEYNVGETVTLSGRMIFVAQYDDVNVTVNGDEVRYGDSVTLTANADAEGSYFKWWTRTVGEETEIVSTDRTYTFCPWESCTVSAVYGDTKQIMAGNLRKIIIDVLGNNAIMAEFIGLDGAEVVEKGIKLGDKKIAMSTNASQFTITNNISAKSASGYAIIKDGETVTEITDGTATLSE